MNAPVPRPCRASPSSATSHSTAVLQQLALLRAQKEAAKRADDIELAAPGLAHRDWTYDSTAERVFFFALQVDEVAVFRFVFTTYSACAGGGTLRPEGLIVDGERAAMVLTAVHTSCNGERFETRVSPVFSLAEPKPWAYQ